MTAFDPRASRSGLPWRPAHSPAQSASDCAALAALAATRLLPSFEHHFLTIGGSFIERRLARLGISTPDRIPRSPLPIAGKRLVSHYLDAREPFDVIQPWDLRLAKLIPQSAPAASFLSPEQFRLILRSVSLPRPSASNGSSALRDQLSAASPGLALPVVLFGADPPDAGDAASMFRVVGIADKSGSRFILVLPRGVRGADRVTRVHRDARIACPLILSERSAIEWLPLADAVLTVAVKDPRESFLRSLAQANDIPVVTSPSTAGTPAETMRDYFAPAATRLRQILADRCASAEQRDSDRAAHAKEAADSLTAHWSASSHARPLPRG